MKKVAIYGWKTGTNSYGITVPYYDFLDYFGEVSILSPVKDIDYSTYDLLVLPGGPDLDPAAYGAIPRMNTEKSDPIRSYFDKYQLPRAIESGIPIVGICRGHQAVAVHFGSFINQECYQATNPPENRTKLVHGIDIDTSRLPGVLSETILRELPDIRSGSEIIKALPEKPEHKFRRFMKVNSLHHQRVARVPEEAVLVATHYDEDRKEDRSIEVLYYPEFNIMTFQYHPEEIWDNLSITCVSYLLSLQRIEAKKVESKITV